MKSKKKYNAPCIKTEKIEIGVFGQYGGNHGGPFGNPPRFGRKPKRGRR